MKLPRSFTEISRVGWMAPATVALLLVLGNTIALGAQTPQPPQTQRDYASAEDAVADLVSAAKEKDNAALAGIFGPEGKELVADDPVQAANELEDFTKHVTEKTELEKSDENTYTLHLGEHAWPFPIPIVRQKDRWHFDTPAGKDEIITRRIGGNEIAAIRVCRAYVLAQWDYFMSGDHDDDGLAEFAQRFTSSEGKRDGLYWETLPGQEPSPLGPLVAAARDEGYTTGKLAGRRGEKGQRTPFHGYYFRILKAQGPNAPGGKFSYVINGNMIAGFALVAYPEEYGVSGVKTFIVAQQGRVYEKNLGPETEKLARALAEYNPDPSWSVVTDDSQ